MTFETSDYRPLYTNGHVQTVYAWAKPRTFPRLPQAVPRFFDVAPDARVLAHCHWHAEPAGHPTLLLLHGLGGFEHGPLHGRHGRQGLGRRLERHPVEPAQLRRDGAPLARPVSLRAHQRSAARHARDRRRDGVRAVAVAGYSLGGNLTLKLAGELGDSFPALKAVCAVSPTMDLAACVKALERRSNIAYEFNFVRRLKARMRRKAAIFPDDFSLERLGRVWTVRQFDEAYTAPHHGFRDASDYYYRASAMRVIDRIRVPALILTAKDDPFVPVDPFRESSVVNNPNVKVVVTPHGGHCAFVERGNGEYDGYWAEREVVRFVTARAL